MSSAAAPGQHYRLAIGPLTSATRGTFTARPPGETRSAPRARCRTARAPTVDALRCAEGVRDCGSRGGLGVCRAHLGARRAGRAHVTPRLAAVPGGFSLRLPPYRRRPEAVCVQDVRSRSGSAPRLTSSDRPQIQMAREPSAPPAQPQHGVGAVAPRRALRPRHESFSSSPRALSTQR
jgi:hypothetical protein